MNERRPRAGRPARASLKEDEPALGWNEQMKAAANQPEAPQEIG